MARLGNSEYPEATLTSSVELARRIHAELGGEVRRDGLAHLLGMSAGGGAFAARIGALRIWGLATGRSVLRLTNDGEHAVSSTDSIAKSNAVSRIAGAVPMFVELNSILRPGPVERSVLTVALQDVTGASMPEILTRVQLIERIFDDVRPLLESADELDHRAKDPDVKSSEREEGHRRVLMPGREGWIDLVFDDGVVSMKETVANIDMMIQALISRKERL